jgi:hypothetical protein
MRKNSGKIVKLPDGRIGQVFNRDIKTLINGKVPVYTYDKITQQDLFNEKSDLSEMEAIGKKILCDPKELKIIGFFD